MENPVREMTLREEIEALNVEDFVKKRLLSKLEKHDFRTTAELARQQEEMYSTIRNLTENNSALLNACESLCRAMVIQRRAIDG